MEQATNRFSQGEIVLYQNGSIFELGEVKEVIRDEQQIQQRLKQDGMFGKPTGPMLTQIKYKYRVWYHTGDTTAMTDENLLHKINNLYAFDITRKKVD